jgi:hypothetical protein
MPAILKGMINECFLSLTLGGGSIFAAKNQQQCSNENLINYYGNG